MPWRLCTRIIPAAHNKDKQDKRTNKSSKGIPFQCRVVVYRDLY